MKCTAATATLCHCRFGDNLFQHQLSWFWGGGSWAAFYIVCRVAREYELVAEIQNIQTDDSGHRAALIHAL